MRRGGGVTPHHHLLCPGTGNVLPCGQRVVLGQCFQDKMCRGTAVGLVLAHGHEHLRQGEKIPGALHPFLSHSEAHGQMNRKRAEFQQRGLQCTCKWALE